MSVKRDFRFRDKRRVNRSEIGSSISSLIEAMKFVAGVIFMLAFIGSFLLYMLSF